MKWDGMGSGRERGGKNGGGENGGGRTGGGERGGEMQVVGEREMREQGHWDC